MERKVSLITMLNGNVLALRKTLESFKDSMGEFVVGDLLIFDEDRKILEDYKSEFNLRTIRLPFDYLYHQGFSSLLNYLSSHCKNDMVLYSNVSEVIDEDYGINKIINDNQEYNTFFFTHRTDKHRWYRCSDRTKIQWGGRLHEEPYGEMNPYHKPIYMMKDLDKDMADPLKAKIFDDIKELTYFNQLCKIVENPKLYLGQTNDGWHQYAISRYDSMIERLKAKGKRWDAFNLGDINMYMEDVMSNPDFEKVRFETTSLIQFQQDRKFHV